MKLLYSWRRHLLERRKKEMLVYVAERDGKGWGEGGGARRKGCTRVRSYHDQLQDLHIPPLTYQWNKHTSRNRTVQTHGTD